MNPIFENSPHHDEAFVSPNTTLDDVLQRLANLSCEPFSWQDGASEDHDRTQYSNTSSQYDCEFKLWGNDELNVPSSATFDDPCCSLNPSAGCQSEVETESEPGPSLLNLHMDSTSCGHFYRKTSLNEEPGIAPNDNFLKEDSREFSPSVTKSYADQHCVGSAQGAKSYEDHKIVFHAPQSPARTKKLGKRERQLLFLDRNPQSNVTTANNILPVDETKGYENSVRSKRGFFGNVLERRKRESLRRCNIPQLMTAFQRCFIERGFRSQFSQIQFLTHQAASSSTEEARRAKVFRYGKEASSSGFEDFKNVINKPVALKDTAEDKELISLSSPLEEIKFQTDKPSTLSSPAEPVVEFCSEPKVDSNDERLGKYKKERSVNRAALSIAIIGQSGAGKSSLMNFLLNMNCFLRMTEDIQKSENSPFKNGVDETSSSGSNEISAYVVQATFKTLHRNLTFIDTSGHKDYIPNMILGLSEADVALLVLDSTVGEFETGFRADGQTGEHTLLARSFGISQLAVVVNKLDKVNWSQERYDEIVAKVLPFLKRAGFNEGEIFFVPCCCVTGENVIGFPGAPKLKRWYSGPCLMDVIRRFRLPKKNVSQPLRLGISCMFEGRENGFFACGRIDSGYVKNGDQVFIMPAAEQATVESITINETSTKRGYAGDNVTLKLSGIDKNSVNTGSVVCDITRPLKATTRFRAQLTVFNITTPIKKGLPVIFHCQKMSEQGFVKKLISQLHSITGDIVLKNPKCLTKYTIGIALIETSRPVCLEVYDDFKALGRFVLRSGGSTVASGRVIEIY